MGVSVLFTWGVEADNNYFFYYQGFRTSWECLFYSIHQGLMAENNYMYLSRESGEEDQSATGLLLRTHSAGPVSQICFYLKARHVYALKPSMTRLHNEELVN